MLNSHISFFHFFIFSFLFRTFAPAKRKRGVAQLVAFLVWDQAVAGSSPVTSTSQKNDTVICHFCHVLGGVLRIVFLCLDIDFQILFVVYPLTTFPLTQQIAALFDIRTLRTLQNVILLAGE